MNSCAHKNLKSYSCGGLQAQEPIMQTKYTHLISSFLSQVISCDFDLVTHQ